MPSNNLLVLCAVIVILALAVYAAMLWRRVWRNQKRLEQHAEERNARLEGDIRILAQSLTAGQMPVIEGAIRIKVLLDNYSGPRQADLNVDIFETIYDATAHIPTHQGWKDLSKSERQLHERHMDTLEQQHKAEVQRVAAQLCSGVH